MQRIGAPPPRLEPGALSEKLGLAENATLVALHAPDDYERWLAPLPPGATVVRRPLPGARLVHLFVARRTDLARELETWRARLDDTGALWISWPKRTSRVATDVTEDVVRAQALPLGFVDVKVCSVSETWSALKLVVRTELRGRGSRPRPLR